MPAPDKQLVLSALRRMIDFTKGVGGPKAATSLEQCYELFQVEKPTLKLLRSKLQDARDAAINKMKPVLFDEKRMVRPDKNEVVNELYEVVDAINAVISPPKFVAKEISTVGFSGSEEVEDKMVRYMGDPIDVRHIFEQSVTLVKRYRKALMDADFEAAYAMTSPELQSWMNLKRFIDAHDKAAREYGGAPVAYDLTCFDWIFPDDEARNNATVGNIVWPRYVPKPIRRATVSGWWVRNLKTKAACAGGLWITEHSDGFRVAKFDYYVP